MPNYAGSLDAVFHALADRTRREIVERLISGPLSVSQLARPLEMSLPAVMQHLQVLEACALVRSEKTGRVRTCHIEPAGLRTAEDWIGRQRTDWEHRLDRLGDHLSEQKQEQRQERLREPADRGPTDRGSTP
ncbi:ArsR/SmtB family transcription factor [Streptomyces sp. NPDC058155]|uniref:ArsR/SmtB family transcription factor n=1 Tax=Streptomyces sp. NPDC058155 TaxID=3346359 RepID=UPI0036E19DB8